ncbi:MAG: hypothetical protein ABIS20_21640 [Thermoanaerobaculia bacterium]
MATNNSFADVMLEWKKILAACADNAPALTAAEPQRLVVEKMLKDAEELKALQDSHQASKQSIRQQLSLIVKEGREAARRLQSAAKSILGTSNERLIHFNIKPNRPRGPRKAKQPLTTKPPTEVAAQVAAAPSETA